MLDEEFYGICNSIVIIFKYYKMLIIILLSKYNGLNYFGVMGIIVYYNMKNSVEFIENCL